MIEKLKLINFRNFDELKIESINKENFIIGENGKGKTNILEAICLLGNNSVTGLSLDEYICKGENNFYVEYINDNGEKISISYTVNDENGKVEKKKNFMLNNKKISRSKFNNITYKCVVFSPIIMNMMYLSPSLRRDYLDDLLKSSFEGYEKLMLDYKKIVKNRNIVLKSISDGRCKKNEIKFWDDKFIESSTRIYKYRFKIVNFLKSSIKSTLEYFSGKIENIEFEYISKVSEENTKEDLEKYLKDNFNRDIILGRTPIGPHVDDFDILIDGAKLTHFASRGETKSIIIWLKLLEGIFIEKMTKKRPLLIIDDLISELDEKHKNILIKKIEYYQTFISLIEMEKNADYNSDSQNIITI